MPESHDVIFNRGQQTLAVWNTFASTFTVGTLTLAQHQTDVAAIHAAANERDLAQDAVDDARSARDTAFAIISNLCVRVPRAIEGQIEPNSPFHDEIADCRAIDPDTQDKALARARRVINLWARYNTARTAMTPPLPVLTVGVYVVAGLQTAITQHPPIMQVVADKESLLSRKRSELRAAAVKVDQDNKRWFAAWEGQFSPGTPERDALSQIDTGSGTPLPDALEIATASATGPGRIGIAYVQGGGDHATTLELLWQRVGADSSYLNAAPAQPDGQEIQDGFVSGQTIKFKTRAVNSTGEVESGIKQVVMP